MNYNQQQPGCSYQHPQQGGYPLEMFPPPDQSQALGNINSPLLPNSALGGSLNHLNNRFGCAVGRPNLPYDFSGGATNFMGGSKPRKGGRRPGDEMVNEDCGGDPEEVEKRLKRRQRNKEAAARCRQRRLDLMSTLQEQVSREKEQNLMKEKEIASVRQALEKVIDFLRVHVNQLPEADRAKFDEIVSTLHKEQPNNGHIFKAEQLDPAPLVNDYLPQQATTRQMQHAGSKRSLLPPTSDISLLEPEHKVPKIEFNTTLGAANGGIDPEVSRPTSLDISGLKGAPAPYQSGTPSNGLTNTVSYTLPSFRPDVHMFGGNISLFGGSEPAPNFLTQSTGLTPSAAPTVGFVAQTPTPLLNSESDLRPL